MVGGTINSLQAGTKTTKETILYQQRKGGISFVVYVHGLQCTYTVQAQTSSARLVLRSLAGIDSVYHRFQNIHANFMDSAIARWELRLATG